MNGTIILRLVSGRKNIAFRLPKSGANKYVLHNAHINNEENKIDTICFIFGPNIRYIHNGQNVQRPNNVQNEE